MRPSFFIQFYQKEGAGMDVIMDDDCVIVWGDDECGGDSNRIRTG